jgi:hypothetical protein
LHIEWSIHSYRFKVCDNNHYATTTAATPMPIWHVLHAEQDVPSRRWYMPINRLQLQRTHNNMLPTRDMLWFIRRKLLLPATTNNHNLPNNLTHHKPHHIANRVAYGFPNYTNLFTHNFTHNTDSKSNHFTHNVNADIGRCPTANPTTES